MSIAALESTWQNERRGYIRCRSLGHSWFDTDSTWESQFGTPLTVRCERCGMERRDTVNRYGELLARHYYRPTGYQLGRDEDKPTRAEYRLMLLALREVEGPNSRRKVRSAS